MSYSGDGTLSVMDVRSKKMEPVAQSEDQEDELLSILSIKGYAHSMHQRVWHSYEAMLPVDRKSLLGRNWASCQYSTARAVGGTV